VDYVTTEVCPIEGETILACDHVKDSEEGVLFFEARPGPAVFRRPDGTSGESRWMVLCGECGKRCLGNPAQFIKRDYAWVGSEPVTVYRPVE
jgi:hypothetical protein